MAEQLLQLYEAMFLVEPDIATDWEAAKGMVQTVMDRANAEMLVCQLWDERRLAYAINKQRRAAYILCYFRVNGAAIGGIERDVQLSEHLLRVLVLRADHITDEELERIKAVPDRGAQPAQVRPSASPAAVPAPQPEAKEETPTVLADDKAVSPEQDLPVQEPESAPEDQADEQPAVDDAR